MNTKILSYLPILAILFAIIPTVIALQTRQEVRGRAQSIANPYENTVINVKSFGAKGDGQTDDTQAIQKAINVAAHFEENGEDKRKDKGFNAYNVKQVFFPAGSYVISSLDLTNGRNIKLLGESTPWGVRLYIKNQAKSQPAIDGTGSSFEMEGITILSQNVDGSPPQVLPSVGILIASSKNGGDSTRMNLRSVSVIGYFDKAAVYIFGSNDNLYENTSFQSWHDTAPALVISDVNFLNIESVHPSGINTGNPFTSDQTFIHSEFHTFKYENGVFMKNVASNSNTAIIQGANGIRFSGGVFSGSGPSLVYFSGLNREIVFDGPFFESENGSAPQHTFYMNSANMNGLSIRNINLSNGVSADGAIIGGKSGTWLFGLTIEGFISGSNNIAKSAKLIDIEDASTPTYTVISNSTIAASGMEIKPGGSISSSIILEGNIIKRPGSFYSFIDQK